MWKYIDMLKVWFLLIEEILSILIKILDIGNFAKFNKG